MSNSNLNLIVDVDVTRQTAVASSLDFNSTMLFSQDPKPDQLAVGRRDASVANLTLLSVADNTAYSVTVQGTVFTHTTGAAATIAEVVDGLAALIVADPLVSAEITATSVDPVLTLTEVTGAELQLNFDYDVYSATYTMEDWTTAVNAITTEYTGAYIFATYDHTVASVLELAGVFEAMTALYFISSANVENLEVVAEGGIPDPANIRGLLEQLNYDRTAFYYSATADQTFLEMAHIGNRIWTLPGKSSWDLAPVDGVVADNLSPTDIQTLGDGNANYFTAYGSTDMVTKGITIGVGEWIDTMRGGDNLGLDVQLEVINLLAKSNQAGSKIPLTDNGVGRIMGVVSAVLENYVTRGFIKDYVTKTDALGNSQISRGYTVSAAKVSTLSTTDKQSRIAPDIQVVAYLAGAVSKAKVLINLFV